MGNIERGLDLDNAPSGECPTCGCPVAVVGGDDGASFYRRIDTSADQLAGAVEALTKAGRLLDRSTQTGKATTQDEWRALMIVNEVIDRLGGQ
jgi:hypothetical protein